jgi:hypothetical protein
LNTIDIPVKTSDAFLRAFSKSTGEAAEHLISPDAPFETLESLASPLEREVLNGLSQTLNLAGNDRSKLARDLAERLEKERGEINREKKKLQGEYQRARNAMGEMLKFRWPEFANPWNPQVAEQLRRDGSEIVAAIEGHTRYSEFSRLHDEISEHSARALDAECRWVKCQRFLRLTENVVLAANLDKVATPEIRDRYRALLDSEADTLCSRP